MSIRPVASSRQAASGISSLCSRNSSVGEPMQLRGFAFRGAPGRLTWSSCLRLSCYADRSDPDRSDPDRSEQRKIGPAKDRPREWTAPRMVEALCRGLVVIFVLIRLSASRDVFFARKAGLAWLSDRGWPPPKLPEAGMFACRAGSPETSEPISRQPTPRRGIPRRRRRLIPI
ncbi:hypothetical protein APED_29910 [Acanthopleuribacter pedis]